MQYLISVIGIIISALLAVPARPIAVAENRKRKIGKELLDILLQLDDIINNGYVILGYLNQGPYNDKDIVNLVKNQVDALKKVIKIVQEDFFANDLLHSVSLSNLTYPFQDKPSSLSKFIRVFGPIMDPSIKRILAEKFSHLSRELEINSKYGNISKSIFYISDIDFIAFDIVCNKPAQNVLLGKTRLSESDKHIKVQRIDLMNDRQRKKYILVAFRRLDRITEEREKLACFIKRHFDPKHIM